MTVTLVIVPCPAVRMLERPERTEEKLARRVLRVRNGINGIHRGKELGLEYAAHAFPELCLSAEVVSNLAKQMPGSLNNLIDREGQKHQQG